ncbi:MAG: hypothetical protein ACTSQ7_17265 [Alphaproteobacteria bacterium]
MAAAAQDPELIPVRADEGLDAARLEGYLHGKLPGAEGELELGQFGGGHANLTYLLRFGATEFACCAGRPWGRSRPAPTT